MATLHFPRWLWGNWRWEEKGREVKRKGGEEEGTHPSLDILASGYHHAQHGLTHTALEARPQVLRTWRKSQAGLCSPLVWDPCTLIPSYSHLLSVIEGICATVVHAAARRGECRESPEPVSEREERGGRRGRQRWRPRLSAGDKAL